MKFIDMQTNTVNLNDKVRQNQTGASTAQTEEHENQGNQNYCSSGTRVNDFA